MADQIYYPSLSSHGWTDSPVITSDALLANFIASEESQTYIYLNKISSLPYIMQECNGDVAKTAAEVQRVLTYYFGRYFNNVIIESNAMEATDGTGNDAITLYIQFTDNKGEVHTLSKLMKTANMKFVEMININNGDLS